MHYMKAPETTMSNDASQELARALELRRSHSLTSLVQREIERMILNGELKGGERINENMLASLLSVSRGPIREACRGLEEAGLVRVVVNRGVFVRQVSLKEAFDAYDIRACLFGLAARTLAANISDDQAATLLGLVTRMEEVQARNDAEAYYPLNLEFHGRIVEFSGNEKLGAVYHGLVRQLHLFRRRGLMNLKASTDEHREILEAIVARDPDRARALAESHVLAGRGRLLDTLAEADAAAPGRTHRQGADQKVT